MTLILKKPLVNRKNKEFQTSIYMALSLIVGLVIGMFTYIFISNTGDYSNVLAAIFGGIVALAIPIWQTYFIQKSKLTIEINGISRKVSDKAKISLDEYSEFSYLRKMREEQSPLAAMLSNKIKRPSQDRSVSLEEFEELLSDAKQELKDAPEKISERKNDLEKIHSYGEETFSRYEHNKLNRPIHPEISYNEEDLSSTLDEFKKTYEERLNTIKEKYDELQSVIPEIERKYQQIKSENIENRSFFEISVTLINSGRLNTSIKKPALFRVYIGKENYIDLKLTLSNFENKSEISPNSTVVGTFSSTDISQLPEEDRKLINTYWGQSVQCVLFVEDVHGEAFFSNSIAFSEGLYQKIIFDRLASVATTHSA